MARRQSLFTIPTLVSVTNIVLFRIIWCLVVLLFRKHVSLFAHDKCLHNWVHFTPCPIAIIREFMVEARVNVNATLFLSLYTGNCRMGLSDKRFVKTPIDCGQTRLYSQIQILSLAFLPHAFGRGGKVKFVWSKQGSRGVDRPYRVANNSPRNFYANLWEDHSLVSYQEETSNRCWIMSDLWRSR